MINTPEKIWSRVNITYSCWEWMGCTVTGYGIFHFNGRRILAHRFFYELFKGLIPKGLVIDHLCRNKKCVYINHLEAVTQKENILRGIGVASQNSKKTHCIHGHKFTLQNTYIYIKKGNKERYCKTCNCIRTKQSQHKNKILQSIKDDSRFERVVHLARRSR